MRAAIAHTKRFVLVPVVLLWALELVDQLLLRRPGLDVYGIVPRTVHGLLGIALAPWLHAGFAHLAANTVPLVVLATLVLTRGPRTLLRVTLGVALLGGLGVWLLGGARTLHLGASGVVFGHLGYVLTVGWFERHLAWMAVSILVAGLYGGAMAGVLPGTPGVSWEAHLFGLLAGVWMARARVRRRA